MTCNIFDLWQAIVWWLRGPNSRKTAIACLAVLVLGLAACEEKKEVAQRGASPVIAVLDVEKVLQDSKAAAQGREHLAAAQKALEAGWTELQKKWQDRPEKQRNQVLADGLKALNAQLANEEAAANKVVLELMMKKAQEWRMDNDCLYVMAKQDLLVAGETADITADVITLMDQETPTFADLPRVTVHEPRDERATTETPDTPFSVQGKIAEPEEQEPKPERRKIRVLQRKGGQL